MMLDEWQEAVAEAQRRIDHGWYAALCAVVFRGFLGGLAASSGSGTFLAQIPYLAALLALAVGVARRSRVAALLLVGQEVWVDGGVAWRERSLFAGALLIGFGYCYVSSLVGTIRYHRLLGRRPEPLADAPASASARSSPA